MDPAAHHDCTECCARGRCHFCLRPGRAESRYEKDGQVFAMFVCATHLSFVASDERAPAGINLDEVYGVDLPEPVRKSEAFESVAVNLCCR